MSGNPSSGGFWDSAGFDVLEPLGILLEAEELSLVLIPIVAVAVLVWLAAKSGLAAGEWLVARPHNASAKGIRGVEVVR